MLENIDLEVDILKYVLNIILYSDNIDKTMFTYVIHKCSKEIMHK